MNFLHRLSPARRSLPRLLIHAQRRDVTLNEQAALSWALVDMTHPVGSPPLAQGHDTQQLASLSRRHPAVLLLGPDTASHFHLPAPKGLRRREWPMLIEEHICGESDALELAALHQGRNHLELVAVERALLQGWQAWLAEHSVSVSHWAVTFMGQPPPPDADSLSVLMDSRQLMIKTLGEPAIAGAPAAEQWLSWPREWQAHLPATLRERHWHLPLGESDTDDAIARLVFYAHHLPATLPRLPAPPEATARHQARFPVLSRPARRLALALVVLTMAHSGLSGWQRYLDHRDETTASQARLAGLLGDEGSRLSTAVAETRLHERLHVRDELLSRNRRVREALAQIGQQLGDAPLALDRMQMAGPRLELAWTLDASAGADGAVLADTLAELGRSAWQPGSRRLSLSLELNQPSTTGDAT